MSAGRIGCVDCGRTNGTHARTCMVGGGSELERALLFQLKAKKLPAPVREHRFHETRKWRWDLCWPDRKLACEVEGGTWVQGRHSRGKGFENDCEKASEGAVLGWRLLRVTNHMVEDGRALSLIERALRG